MDRLDSLTSDLEEKKPAALILVGGGRETTFWAAKTLLKGEQLWFSCRVPDFFLVFFCSLGLCLAILDFLEFVFV